MLGGVYYTRLYLLDRGIAVYKSAIYAQLAKRDVEKIERAAVNLTDGYDIVSRRAYVGDSHQDSGHA